MCADSGTSGLFANSRSAQSFPGLQRYHGASHGDPFPDRSGDLHGPVGTSNWTPFTTGELSPGSARGQTPVFANPSRSSGKSGSTRHRIRTIRPGRARGPLLGGNLTVLSALMGSRYLPAWEGAILFLEDVGEEIYRVDRMLTQLKLAGVLDQIVGLVFGHCTDCKPGVVSVHSRWMRCWEDHLLPLRFRPGGAP